MSEPKTALDLARGWAYDENERVETRLRAIPADAPEQIAALETRREETIAMCAQLDAEKTDLTAKLAGAMGALDPQCSKVQQYHPDTLCCIGCRDEPRCVALADEPHASKRLRAIEKAAEGIAAEHQKETDRHNANRPEYGMRKDYVKPPCECGICKAERGEGE